MVCWFLVSFGSPVAETVAEASAGTTTGAVVSSPSTQGMQEGAASQVDAMISAALQDRAKGAVAKMVANGGLSAT